MTKLTTPAADGHRKNYVAPRKHRPRDRGRAQQPVARHSLHRAYA